jgi:hypothetical protein
MEISGGPKLQPSARTPVHSTDMSMLRGVRPRATLMRPFTAVAPTTPPPLRVLSTTTGFLQHQHPQFSRTTHRTSISPHQADQDQPRSRGLNRHFNHSCTSCSVRSVALAPALVVALGHGHSLLHYLCCTGPRALAPGQQELREWKDFESSGVAERATQQGLVPFVHVAEENVGKKLRRLRAKGSSTIPLSGTNTIIK